MKKRYYSAIRQINNVTTIDIWHVEPNKALQVLKGYDFIIPLDRKPRNSFILEA